MGIVDSMLKTANIFTFGKEFIESNLNDFKILFQCNEYLLGQKFVLAMKRIQLFIKPAIPSENLDQSEENNIENSLKITLSDLSLLLISMSLLGEKDKIALDMREIPTFLCEILSNDNIEQAWDIFYRLRVLNSDFVEGKSKLTGQKKKIIIGIAILLQISAPQLAIRILFRNIEVSIEPTRIILGFVILNHNLNTAIETKKEQVAKQYVNVARSAIEKTANGYVSHLANLKQIYAFDASLISSIILYSSKFLGLLIASIALPQLAIDSRILLNVEAFIPTQKLHRENNTSAKNIRVSSFVSQFAGLFCNCSPEACQKVLNQYFTSSRNAELFNIILQEIAQILGVCQNEGIIQFNSEKVKPEQVIGILSLCPPKSVEQIRLTIIKVLVLFWQFGLLLTIEGCNQEPLSKIRLAGCLIRYSKMAGNEQQKLEFIQLGISVLQSTNFCQIKMTSKNEIEAIEDLGNAFDVYTEKWESIIKFDKEKLDEIIKKVLSIYNNNHRVIH